MQEEDSSSLVQKGISLHSSKLPRHPSIDVLDLLLQQMLRDLNVFLQHGANVTTSSVKNLPRRSPAARERR